MTQTHPVRLALSSLAIGLIFGGFAVRRFGMPEPPREPEDTPVTFDPGVTTTPAISPDGKLLAYASDRDGGHSLDLYVQQFRGGDPERLTWTKENESDPTFSSDGTAIAYHSTLNGGGIYLIPSLGGTPRLLAPGGRNPRFSPKGNLVAYWTGLRDALAEGQAKSFIVSIAGGAPRQIRGDFSVVQRPVWSPDGERLIVWGVSPGGGPAGDRADFWVNDLERDRVESAGLLGPVTRAGGTLASVDDMIWTEWGLVFSMRTGWVRNIYRCRVSNTGRAQGDLQRLAGGTASAEYPAASRDGQMIFASGTERFDVWGLPLDADRGKALGPHYRITDSTAPAEYPAVSPDGRKVLYATSRNGISQIWMKDLAKGVESVAAPGPGSSLPLWLRGKGAIAYVQKTGKQSAEYVLDPASSQSVKVYDGGFFWDVNQASTVALAQAESNRNDIVAVDLKTGQSATILRALPGAPLIQANYSPDDEWVVFVANSGPGAAQIHAAHPNGLAEIPGSDWRDITDGRRKVDKPRFSPDGKLIYFTQDEDASRVIRAIRFDPRTGRSGGESFTVFDSDQPHLALFGVNPGSLEIGIGKDKLVMLLAERTSNLWLTSLQPR